MPVLTDEAVGLAAPSLSDADVGLGVLSDEDVGLDTPKPKSEKYLAMQKELAALQEKDEGGTAAKVLAVAENIVRPFKDPIGETLKLAEQGVAAAFNSPVLGVKEAPLITTKAVHAVVGKSASGTVARGAQEFVAEMVSGLTTPSMLATMAAGTKAPVPVGRYFQGEMLSHLPESVQAAAQAEGAQESTKATLAAASNVLFPALIQKGIAKAEAPKPAVVTTTIIERAKEVGPATEAALSGKESKPTASTPEPATVPPTTTTGETVKPATVESPAAAEPSLPISTIQKDIKQPEPKIVGMGGAVPAEFELSAKTPTGIKNVTVDQERIKRGLPAAMQPARRSFGTVWDSAMAKIDQDPAYTDRLVSELRENPRALTDIEDATLLHRQIELQNEYGKATRDLAQAFDDGRMEDVASEKLRVAALSDQLLNLYNIDKAAGTETGRGLNARKMMAYEDFSLAKMELEKRAAKNGEQLTDAERAEVVRQNREIEATQKALDEHTTKAEEQGRETATDAAVAKVKGAPKSPDNQADLLAGIKDKFDSKQLDGVSSLVQRLARLFVEQGIKERDPLVAAVHDVLKTIVPEITRRDTMDMISGYGQFKRLSKDEISVKLRDLKGQMQQIAKLEDMQASTPPRKTGTERRAPSDEERRLIKLVNEAKNKFQIPITDEATQLKSSLDTLKTRLRNQIVDFEARLKAKDFEKKPKRFIQMDEKAQKLHFEAAKAKARWHQALMKDRLARRSLPAKILGNVGETLSLVRAIMTSGEFSGVLRQGGFIGIGNPARIVKAFPAMLRAFRSEAQQHAVNMEIMARPNYPLYVRSKLYLAEHGQKLSQMEEAYMSRWAEKIPFVAGTQRAYSTFLNKLRADSFDAMSKTLVRRTGELTPERANANANFINVATGRGNLAGKEAALVGMNQYFFAPRWVASRFQLILGQPFMRGDKHTRRLIAEEYGKFLIGMGVIYGLWRMSGEEVETDPRSSDFGKLRVGETRVDLMAGLQQGTVLIGRLASGETKRLSGKIVPIRGQDIPFGGDDSAQVIGRFLRTKMAPVPASAVDLLSGTDVIKRPVTPQSELLELSVPLTYRDIYKAMLEQGVPVGTALSLLAIFGAGVQTYDQ